jgi:hypothetical protein
MTYLGYSNLGDDTRNSGGVNVSTDRSARMLSRKKYPEAGEMC